MASDSTLTSTPAQAKPVAEGPTKLPRVWPAGALVGLYWLCGPVLRWLEVPGFAAWLTIMAALAVLMFCCVDAATGERRWKDGRYDHGQVLLLADQALLVVVSENGAVILLKANAEEHEELGRFQAIKGKTWNHPALAHGRLYVRNGEEMACYDLSASTRAAER